MQVKGVEKIMDRMKKARIDTELKKRMTERSDFSGGNYKKVKKIIKKELKTIQNQKDGMNKSISAVFNQQGNKFKSAFGMDGA